MSQPRARPGTSGTSPEPDTLLRLASWLAEVAAEAAVEARRRPAQSSEPAAMPAGREGATAATSRRLWTR